MSLEPVDNFRELSELHHRVAYIEPEVGEEIARAMYEAARVVAVKHGLILQCGFRPPGSAYSVKFYFNFRIARVEGVTQVPPPFGVIKRLQDMLAWVFDGPYVKSRDLRSPLPELPEPPSEPVE